jgi:hypothetical protein
MSATSRQTVSEAASKQGVPFWVLWGVYGAESSWGRGGSNWFGLVAVPRTGSFAGDAQASASTLKRLYGEHGTWEGAIRAYSGNEYGVNHVRQLAAQEGASTPTPEASSSASSTSSAGGKEGLGEWLANLTEKAVLYVGFVAAGGLLILYGTKVALQPVGARQ